MKVIHTKEEIKTLALKGLPVQHEEVLRAGDFVYCHFELDGICALVFVEKIVPIGDEQTVHCFVVGYLGKQPSTFDDRVEQLKQLVFAHGFGNLWLRCYDKMDYDAVIEDIKKRGEEKYGGIQHLFFRKGI